VNSTTPIVANAQSLHLCKCSIFLEGGFQAQHTTALIIAKHAPSRLFPLNRAKRVKCFPLKLWASAFLYGKLLLFVVSHKKGRLFVLVACDLFHLVHEFELNQRNFPRIIIGKGTCGTIVIAVIAAFILLESVFGALRSESRDTVKAHSHFFSNPFLRH
jgi:hypothetical protein